MDYKEPKTRKEMKGRDKERGGQPYSQKHIRLQEALAEKRVSKPQPVIQERLKRVEGEIALWRRRHSICDPTNVWDLRQLEAERRHWQQMLQALKLNRGGSQ